LLFDLLLLLYPYFAIMSTMIILPLTGIPSPEAFLGVEQGSNLSLLYEAGHPGADTVMTPVRDLSLRCEKIAHGGGGVAMSGVITSPPEFSGRMALVDIFWDMHPGYLGQVAIGEGDQ
jgi:hypothetical protein